MVESGRAPAVTRDVVEATAPTRIDLAGRHPRHLAALPLPSRRGDRQRRHRPPRLVPGGDRASTGVRIESKDTLRKAEGRDVAEVLGGGRAVAGGLHPARPRHRDRRQGRDAVAGARRAPAWAARRRWPWPWRPRPRAAVGRELDADGLWPVVRDAEAQAIARAHRACRTTWPPSTAACSASTSSRARCASRSWPPIPARVEECLLLVDAGVTPLLRASTTGRSSRARSTATRRVREAPGRDRRRRPRRARGAGRAPLRGRGRAHGRGVGRRASAWPRASPRPRSTASPRPRRRRAARPRSAARAGEAWSRCGRVPGTREKAPRPRSGRRASSRCRSASTCAASRSE